MKAAVDLVPPAHGNWQDSAVQSRVLGVRSHGFFHILLQLLDHQERSAAQNDQPRSVSRATQLEKQVISNAVPFSNGGG
eukprot:6093566-Amphidinium_carterae.1